MKTESTSAEALVTPVTVMGLDTGSAAVWAPSCDAIKSGQRNPALSERISRNRGSPHIGRRPEPATARIRTPGGRMEWTIIGMNFLYAALGVCLMFISYRVIDKLTPQVNFAEELRKGNVAVGVFVAAIFLAIAIIIGGALN
jgi:hypothetical protein